MVSAYAQWEWLGVCSSHPFLGFCCSWNLETCVLLPFFGSELRNVGMSRHVWDAFLGRMGACDRKVAAGGTRGSQGCAAGRAAVWKPVVVDVS